MYNSFYYNSNFIVSADCYLTSMGDGYTHLTVKCGIYFIYIVFSVMVGHD